MKPNRHAIVPRLVAIALALAASPALSEPAPPPPGASLESLLELARSRNSELAATRHEADATTQRVYPAGALPDPIFRTELENITNTGSDLNPNLLPGRVGGTKYTFIQPVPFWGKRDLMREAAEAAANQAQGRATVEWVDLAARIKSAYAQFYAAARAEALTQEILVLANNLEKIAQVRYANGLTPQQDVIRAQIEQTGIRSELVNLGTEYHHAIARINALLNRPAMAPLAEPRQLRPLPTPDKFDENTLELRLRARNPLLFVDQARVVEADKNRELAYKNRYPDFNLGISPIQSGNRVSEWGVMIEVNIPLQQESRRAREREAQALLLAAESRKDATQNQLRADLSKNLAALDAARRIEILAHGSLLPQAELTFKAALAGYENGKVDFATLLDAQRQIRKAKLDELKAQTDAQIGLAEIERLLGEEL